MAIASPSTQFALALVSDKVFADDTSERRAASEPELFPIILCFGTRCERCFLLSEPMSLI